MNYMIFPLKPYFPAIQPPFPHTDSFACCAAPRNGTFPAGSEWARRHGFNGVLVESEIFWAQLRKIPTDMWDCMGNNDNNDNYIYIIILYYIILYYIIFCFIILFYIILN